MGEDVLPQHHDQSWGVLSDKDLLTSQKRKVIVNRRHSFGMVDPGEAGKRAAGRAGGSLGH